MALSTPVRWCARKEAIRFFRSSGEREYMRATARLGVLTTPAYVAASAINSGLSAVLDQSA
jgi:hypothetical protein